MSDTELEKVVKADLGLTLCIPTAWKEQPPDLRNSLTEVARFVEESTPRPAICLVFWRPSPHDETTRQAAEGAKKSLQANFQNFAFYDVTFAGRKATRLDFDRRLLDQAPPSPSWSVWQFRAKHEGHMLCVGLGTLDIEGDRELFEQMAATVELHDPADSGSLSEIALCRYSKAARRVIARSGRMAHELGEHTLHPRHLIYSLAEEGGSVPVMLNALGVTRDKLSIPELSEPERSENGAEPRPDIWVGEELYEVLTKEAQKMGVASVKPVDVLSAMVSAMPESVSALGK